MADEKLDNETQDEATEAVVDEANADPVEVEAEVDAVEEPPAEAEAEPVEAEVEPVAEAEAEQPATEDEPVTDAEAEPTAEAPAEPTAEAAEEAPAEAVAPARKQKKKRLPRALRPQRTRPKREKPAERKPITRLPKLEHARGRRQERLGSVVSAAGDKTIVVRVDTLKPHPVYKKIVRHSRKFHAHDETNVAKAGDVVRIVETRPISKTKSWRLAEVLEEAK